jgi:FixJ family two-component response regulator
VADTKAMTLRLSAERAAELEAIARAEEMPISETVRVAIDRLIEDKRKDKQFQARLRELMEQEREVLDRLAR